MTTKNSIEESFDQSQEKSSRSKVESALDVLKNATLYSEKGHEMQGIFFKFEKLFALNDEIPSNKMTKQIF